MRTEAERVIKTENLSSEERIENLSIFRTSLSKVPRVTSPVDPLSDYFRRSKVSHLRRLRPWLKFQPSLRTPTFGHPPGSPPRRRPPSISV